MGKASTAKVWKKNSSEIFDLIKKHFKLSAREIFVHKGMPQNAKQWRGYMVRISSLKMYTHTHTHAHMF